MSLDAALYFRFSDVIGVEQVWWLSINLQSNKVVVFVQISLLSIRISLNKFKALSNKSMHWIQLVDHWLWPSMFQSNWWPLLPRVQSTPLVWVGDHNHGLLIYIFWQSLHFSSSIWYQSLGWWWHWFNISRNLFLTRMSHHLVEPFDSMN